MSIYYKYGTLFPLSYFDEPTIKISQIEHLNDPFEFNTSENIIRSIDKYIRCISQNDELVSEVLDVSRDGIYMTIAYNGIVSFSETPRNSLMWAHYADQHNGMCIGYKEDVIEHISIEHIALEDDKRYLILIKKPQKINYDNLRFDPEYVFEQGFENISREATINHLLKKSDEWIYEKEHRCIVPLCCAQILQIKRGNATVDRMHRPTRRTKPILKAGHPYENIIEKGISHGFISKTETPGKYIINSSDVVEYEILQSSKDALMLVKIDPKSIQSIYFGCKVGLDKIRPYYEKLHNMYSIFRFEISEDRFELVPKKITSDMFTEDD